MATTFWKTLFGRRIAACALSAAPVLFAGFCGLAPSEVAMAATAAPADESNGLLALDQSMEALVARVTPSVVNITASWRADRRETADDENQFDDSPGRSFGPGSPFGRGFVPPIERNPRPERGLGSGIIISPDGYILTNNHVVDGASSIRVTTSDRDVYPAKLIGADALTDLAVIKIEAGGLSFLSWGDSSKLKPGQMVLAFGNPYGFSFSVTRGIISALNRPNPTADRYRPGQYIQTDAAINQGNSGGPLVDAKGQVVGINSFVISPTGAFSGMGFAIPAEIARPISDRLAREGKIVHGFLGVSINDVTPENVQFFGLAKAIGALVNSVLPNSPGEKAGLKSGDVITGLNGDPVSNAGELQMGVVVRQPGETIRLRVMRAGQPVDIPVTLEPISGDPDRATAQGKASREVWGLGLSDLTQQIQLTPRHCRGRRTYCPIGESRGKCGAHARRCDHIRQSEADRHLCRGSSGAFECAERRGCAGASVVEWRANVSRAAPMGRLISTLAIRDVHGRKMRGNQWRLTPAKWRWILLLPGMAQEVISWAPAGKYGPIRSL